MPGLLLVLRETGLLSSPATAEASVLGEGAAGALGLSV